LNPFDAPTVSVVVPVVPVTVVAKGAKRLVPGGAVNAPSDPLLTSAEVPPVHGANGFSSISVSTPGAPIG
jgi:hypothetical protein